MTKRRDARTTCRCTALPFPHRAYSVPLCAWPANEALDPPEYDRCDADDRHEADSINRDSREAMEQWTR